MIVEFADFTCPHCQAFAPVLDKFVDEHKNDVLFAYKFLPLTGPGHERAEPAARAAWAARDQGKFWEMHKKLFENPEHLEQGDFESYAKELGLDVAKFRQDMQSQPTTDKINADKKLADALDVHGTPTIYINGRECDQQPGPRGVDRSRGAAEGREGRAAARSARAVDVEQREAEMTDLGIVAPASQGPVPASSRRASARLALDGCGCFPSGRHYPGIAHLLRTIIRGLAEEFAQDVGVARSRGRAPRRRDDRSRRGGRSRRSRSASSSVAARRNRRTIQLAPQPGHPDPAGVARRPRHHRRAGRLGAAFEAVAHEIADALRGRVPAAYNADFDKTFLLSEFARIAAKTESPPPALRREVEWVDPLVWAREIQADERSRALSDVAARLGVAHEKAHRASDDAEAALRVLYALAADARVPTQYGAARPGAAPPRLAPSGRTPPLAAVLLILGYPGLKPGAAKSSAKRLGRSGIASARGAVSLPSAG